MKLLITGPSRFVASQIIPHLRASRVELVLVSRNVSALQAAYPDCMLDGYNAWDIALRSIPLELKVILASATGTDQGDKTRGN